MITEPISTCNSLDPRIKASGTTTCRLTKCAIMPVDVDTYKQTNTHINWMVEKERVKKIRINKWNMKNE